MKISFEKQIFLGFIINILIIVIMGWSHLTRINSQHNPNDNQFLEWVTNISLILSFLLLIFVYIIIKTQLRIKKIAQQHLLDNKHLLQSIIDNTSNSISIKLINGEYLLVNNQFETLFGISKDKILGKTDHDLFPKDIADSYRNSDVEVMKVGKEIIVEEIINQEFGPPHTYLAAKFPLYDNADRIYAIGVISTNISDRKIIEDSLKSGDKFFNMSLEILVIAANNSFVKVNPSLSKTLGFSEEELLSKPFLSFIHPDDLESTLNEIKKLGTGVNTINFENRWICKDGSIKWLSWLTVPDLSDGKLYAVAHDITEQKAKEEQIRQLNLDLENNLSLLSRNEEKFRVIFEAAPDAVITIDQNGIITGWNPQAERMFGFNQAEVIGKELTDNIIPERFRNGHKNGMTHLFNTVEGPVLNKSIEIFAVKKDCTEFPIELKISPTSKLNDQLNFIVFIRDITERKKTEDELKVAEKFFNLSYDMLVVANSEYFIKVNAAFTRILGYDQKDMDDRPFLSFSHPDEIAMTRKAIDNLLKGDSIMNFRARGKCKDGTYKILDWTASSDLKTGLIYSVVRDVTELVKTEEDLKITNNFFETSFDVFFVAKENRIIKINTALTKILGYDLSELESKTIIDLIHPDYKALATENLSKRLKGKAVNTNVIYPLLCKDGSYKWVEAIVTSDVNSGLIYAVLRNITDRIKSEENLKIADTFFNMTFNIFAVGKGDLIIKINPALTEILGYTQKDLDVTPFSAISDNPVESKKLIDKLLKGEKIVKYSDNVLCKDGSKKWVNWNIVGDAKTGMVYIVGNDISSQIKKDEEVQNAINDLSENEEKLNLILENIGEGVIVANPKKEIILANYMANEIFEVEENEKISFNLADHFQLFFPDEQTIFPSQNLPTMRVLNGETTEDVEIVLLNLSTHNKKRVLISGRPLIDTENKVVAAVMTIKDITKYKLLEDELKDTESKYRRMIGFKKGGQE